MSLETGFTTDEISLWYLETMVFLQWYKEPLLASLEAAVEGSWTMFTQQMFLLGSSRL